MNKSQFIKVLSQNCGLSQNKCNEVMSTAYYLICKNLREGDYVSFKGFGKFYVKTKKERFIKSFNSDHLQIIGCRNVPSFKMGKSFKQEIK